MATVDGAAYTFGTFTNKDVTVTLSCADNPGGSGCKEMWLSTGPVPSTPSTPYKGPITITAEGTTFVCFRSQDYAGNVESTKCVQVKIDKTPPEAFLQFDPATKDVAVFGRDLLSSVSPGPVSPTSVVPTDEGKAELRTYKVIDQAENSLQLVVKVKKKGNEVKAQVLSLRYNDGPILTAQRNSIKFEFALNKDGMLKELTQKMEIGTGKAKRQVEAKFEAKKNQTVIREGAGPETKVVKPGLVLLRMATDKGMLSIDFDGIGFASALRSEGLIATFSATTC